MRTDAPMPCDVTDAGVGDAAASPGVSELRADEFVRYLEASFPALGRRLEWRRPGPFSLLGVWDGADRALPVAVLMAHWDVAGVSPKDEGRWQHPPFSGHIDERFVWGRGALDDKLSLVTLLEAAERLVLLGFHPERTIVFAFGGDEECGGHGGAATAARIVAESFSGVDFVIDEGGVILSRVPQVPDRPVALLCTAETGRFIARVHGRARGGAGRSGNRARSSSSDAESVSRRLVAALRAAERRAFRRRIPGSVAAHLRVIGSGAAGYTGFAMRHPWLCARSLRRRIAPSVLPAGAIRSTVDARVIDRGNVSGIPEETAEIAVRLVPGDTVDSALRRIRRIFRRFDLAVELDNTRAVEDPVVGSDHNSSGYGTVVAALQDAFPDSIPSPFLLAGATDSRHLRRLTSDIIRFTPVILEPGETRLMHAIDERVSHENIAAAVQFYTELIRRSGARPTR